MRTLFFTLALLTAFLGTSGCGEKDAVPAPDRVPAQATQALFRALAANRKADLERALGRLRDLNPQDPFPQQFRQQLDGLVEINRCLAQGRLSGAQQVLARLEREIGAVPALLPARDALAALAAVAAYHRGEPYRTSQTLEQALTALRIVEAPLKEAPAYADWIKLQELQLARLVRREKLAAFTTRLLAYDADMTAGSRDALKSLAVLRAVAAGMTNLPTAAKLVLAETPGLAELEGCLLPARWQDRDERPALELLFCREWPRLTPELRARLAPLAIGPAIPTTVSGKILLIRACLATGQNRRAREWTEHVARRHAVSPELAGAALTAFALPPEQFRSKPWSTPFPTVTDYLERLEQLRRSEPGK